MTETTAVAAPSSGLLHRAIALGVALRSKPSDLHIETAAQLLPELQNAHAFEHLLELAELVCRFMPENLRAKGLLVQGLIETGQLITAIGVGEAALHNLGVHNPEFHELSGLLGRAHKQLYFDHAWADTATRQLFLKRAWKHYATSYEFDPTHHLWHGINMAALSHAATRQGMTMGWRSASELASEVISHLNGLRVELRDHHWHATLAEALVAQERWAEAQAALETYVTHAASTAFSFASTLRQLREVWALGEQQAGLALLERFESLLMRDWDKRECSAMTLAARHVQNLRSVQTDVIELQRQYGPKGAATIEWYRQGLSCAAAVAAIEEYLGVRFGTGFLVRGQDFGRPDPAELLLLTNFHVLSSETERTGPGFNNIRIKLEAHPDGMRELEVSSVIAESPTDTGLDYALLSLRGDTSGLNGLEITVRVPALSSRIYLIGCPLGQVMQISLHDSVLIDHECPDIGRPPLPERRRLHYSAATEQGSSGSPVFDEKWRCIGLHHAGGKIEPSTGRTGLPALNGGLRMVEANQGVWIQSIIEDVRRQLS